MQLVHAKSGQLEDVPQDDVLGALTKGTHNMMGGTPVNVISPEGKIGSLPAEQVPEALSRYGYKIPTSADLNEFEKQQKYGEGLGSELKAGAAGVARGATFGLSDVGLTQSGLVDPETLHELRTRNPAASTVGEVGGAIGSVLAMPGASLPGLAGKAGAGIAAKLAPAALEGGSLAARVVQAAKATGATALGSAVEGTFYSAGETVTEAALGDPDMHAEKLAANLGFGALIGGGLGGLVKAGSLAVPESLGAAKGAISKFYDRFIGRPTTEAVEASAAPEVVAHAAVTPPPADWQPSPVSKAMSALTGKPEEETRSLLQAAHEGELMTPEAKDKFVREFTDNLQKQYDTVQKASKEAINTVRPQETAKLLEGADSEAAAGASSEAVTKLRHAVAEMRTNPDIFPARFPAKTELILEGLEDRSSVANAADHFEAINQAKRSLDKILNFGKDITGESADAINLLRDVRGTLRDSLEDESVWGPAATRQAAFNASNHDLETSAKLLRKRFMEKVEGKGGSVQYKVKPSRVETYVNQINDNRGRPQTEALLDYFRAAKSHIQEVGNTYEGAPFESFDKEGVESILNKTQDAALRAKTILEAQPGGHGAMTDWLHPLSAVHKASKVLSNPVATASTLANMERAAQKTTATVEKAAAAVFKSPGKAEVRGSSLPVKFTGAAVHGMSLEDRRAKAEREIKKIDNLQNSPELLDKLDMWTQSTFDHAPNVTAALQQTAIRGLAFLGSKIPRMGASLPFDAPRQAGSAQLASFSRYLSAVEDPLSVMRGLKHAELSSEGLEALQAVYPKLYDDMKQQVIAKLAERGDRAKSLPYQQRLTLSRFVGQPLDSALLYTASNQTVLASIQQQNDEQETAQQAVRPTQKGLSSINLSQREKTPSQQIADKTVG